MSPAEKMAAGNPVKYTQWKKVWKCRLKEHRQSLDLSGRQVCRAVGIGDAWYYAVENGADPSLTVARRLAEFFGKTVEELWPEGLP